MKDGIEDTGPRMTRRTLLAAAPLAAAPFKSSLENSNSRWDGPGGTAREVNTSNFAISKSIAGVPGDTWFFPRGYGHALQGLGPGECHFLLGFDDGDFSEFGTFSITDWISRTPRRIVERNLQLPESVVAGLPKREVYIVQGKVPKLDEPFRNANLEPSQLTHKYRLGAAGQAMSEFKKGVASGIPEEPEPPKEPKA